MPKNNCVRLKNEDTLLSGRSRWNLERRPPRRFADMRYRGQEHTLKIRLPDAMSTTNQGDIRAAFESEYTKRYGHSSKNVPIDLVNLRVVVTGVADKPSMNDVEAGGVVLTPETREVNFDGEELHSLRYLAARKAECRPADRRAGHHRGKCVHHGGRTEGLGHDRPARQHPYHYRERSMNVAVTPAVRRAGARRRKVRPDHAGGDPQPADRDHGRSRD